MASSTLSSSFSLAKPLGFCLTASLLVADVAEGGQARRLGVQAGMRVAKASGRELATADDFFGAIARAKEHFTSITLELCAMPAAAAPAEPDDARRRGRKRRAPAAPVPAAAPAAAPPDSAAVEWERKRAAAARKAREDVKFFGEKREAQWLRVQPAKTRILGAARKETSFARERVPAIAGQARYRLHTLQKEKQLHRQRMEERERAARENQLDDYNHTTPSCYRTNKRNPLPLSRNPPLIHTARPIRKENTARSRSGRTRSKQRRTASRARSRRSRARSRR